MVQSVIKSTKNMSRCVRAVKMLEEDCFKRAAYFALCPGSFLFLLSLLSLSFNRVIRVLPLNTFCCHSADFMIASK